MNPVIRHRDARRDNLFTFYFLRREAMPPRMNLQAHLLTFIATMLTLWAFGAVFR